MGLPRDALQEPLQGGVGQSWSGQSGSTGPCADSLHGAAQNARDYPWPLRPGRWVGFAVRYHQG